MERSLLLFKESSKSQSTFQEYIHKLGEFMRYCDILSYDEMTRQKNLQTLLEDWIIHKKQTVNPNGLPNYLYVVKSFLDVNEIDLKWKKILRLLPAKIRTCGRRPYSTQQLHHIPLLSKHKNQSWFCWFYLRPMYVVVCAKLIHFFYNNPEVISNSIIVEINLKKK